MFLNTSIVLNVKGTANLFQNFKLGKKHSLKLKDNYLYQKLWQHFSLFMMVKIPLNTVVLINHLNLLICQLLI